jgi:hypothetical protein
MSAADETSGALDPNAPAAEAAEAEAAGRPSRPASQLPEPGRLWVRYVPRVWETPEQPWIHVASGRLGEWSRRGSRTPPAGAAGLSGPAALAETPLDDVLYLPPVPPRRAQARDDLAATRLAAGTPVLIQLFPGETTSLPPVRSAAVVVDLLPALLGGDLDRIGRAPAGAAAVWTLLPGLTDDPDLWERGCGRLATEGFRCVQALAPELAPADRRRLFEGWGNDERFEAVFHREPPPERAFARVAHRHGLEPFLARPLPRAPVLAWENRRIGAALALIGELWLRLGRPVEQGQAFYRAARWVDETTYDLEALVREGNLGVVKPLDESSRRIVTEHVEDGEPELLAALLAEYLEIEEEENPG